MNAAARETSSAIRWERKLSITFIVLSICLTPSLRLAAQSWGAVNRLTRNDVDDHGHLLLSDGDTILAAWQSGGSIQYALATSDSPNWTPTQALPERYDAHSYTLLGGEITLTALVDGLLVARPLQGQEFGDPRALSEASAELTFASNHPVGDGSGYLWWPVAGDSGAESAGGDAPPYVLRRQRPGEAYTDIPFPIILAEPDQLGNLMFLPEPTEPALWLIGFSSHRIDSRRLRASTPYLYHSFVGIRWDGTTWELPNTIFPLTWPVNLHEFDAAVDATGAPNVLVGAQKDGMIGGDYGQQSVWLTRWSNGEFDTETRASETFQFTKQASLAIDASGRAYAVWQQLEEANGWQTVHFAAEDGEIFSAPEQVSARGRYTTLMPDIAVFDDGSGVVLWMEFDGRDFDLLSRRWQP